MLYLSLLNIIDYFDDLTFSDEIGLLKPETMIFQVALRKLAWGPKESVFIGDSQQSDIAGAKNAGLAAHLFSKSKDDLYQIALSYSGDYE